MDETLKEAYRKVLKMKTLRQNLSKAGLYSLAFELLKRTVIDHPKGFLTHFGASDQKRYNKEVLSLDKKDLLAASSKWFQQNGALTGNEVNEIADLREYRNRVVHELQNIILSPEIQVDEEKLFRIYELLSKVELWWITEIELPANEDFDRAEIDPTEIKGGRTDFLKLLIYAVFHDEENDPKPAQKTH